MLQTNPICMHSSTIIKFQSSIPVTLDVFSTVYKVKTSSKRHHRYIINKNLIYEMFWMAESENKFQDVAQESYHLVILK